MAKDATKKDDSKTPTGTADGKEQKKPCCKGKEASKICKASDLPMYGNPYPPQDVIRNSGMLEETIRSAREAIAPNFKFLEGSIDRSKQFVNTAISHTQSTVDMIRDEKNDIAKAVAITGGGLFGLLISARKGFFKKILYTSLGIGSVAGVCYPKKTYELMQISGYIVTNKLPVVVKDYTGVDVAGMIPTKKTRTDKTSDATVAAELKQKSAEIAKDRDQSKPVDKDMISNRSTK